jgi:hypothetical protein
MRRVVVVLIALTLTLGLARPAATVERIAAAIHVHSSLTTGQFSLDELATMGERAGLGAIFLAENYRLAVEYGLPPFHALTRVTYEQPSVSRLGIERYLTLVSEAQQRHPGIRLVPGVEVIPHYRWTGSPWSLAMTLHDTQKNVLVFGLSDPAALERLPAIGNPRARRFGVQSVLDTVPVLLLIPGVWIATVKRRRRIRIGYAWVIVRERRWWPSALLCVVGAAALVRGWPFTSDRYPSWTEPGLVPHQELIDDVAVRGGATVWSFPEAADSGQRAVGPVRVTWRTEPYPDDLLRTARYTAFGALYEDTTSFEQPGRGWDRLLGEAARRERTRPAWAIGEAGFHALEAGKRLDGVQTVFFADARSEAGLLAALRRGSMYALQRSPDARLVLDEFSATHAGGVAASGETLHVPPGSPITVTVAVDAASGPLGVRIALVRNGTVVATSSATTPARVVYREPFDGAPTFFRADVVASVRPNRLLTNPIFVAPP